MMNNTTDEISINDSSQKIADIISKFEKILTENDFEEFKISAVQFADVHKKADQTFSHTKSSGGHWEFKKVYNSSGVPSWIKVWVPDKN